jgi:hypothetical protein
MKIPLTILAIVVLILAAFQWLAPPPDPESLKPRTDLPWQVTAHPDGSSRVFDLDLGEATLGDAIAKFGTPEGMAVFEPKSGPLVLEAYFGNVQFGPLTAKILVALEAGEAELQALKQGALDRQGSPSGDWKYPIGERPEQHSGRRLNVITYIPGTRNLDAGFIRERFGEPAATLRENERAESWFYPDKGLSILIDERAREVLEYQPPRRFVMPDGVTPNPAAE